MDGGPKPERGRAESMGKEGKGVTKEKRRNEWTTADRGTQWRAGWTGVIAEPVLGTHGTRENITQGMSDPRMALPQECRGGRVMTRPRMRRRLGVVTFIVACAFFVFGKSWAGTTGTISGTVTDSKTGEPIGLATVTVPELKRGATSDAQGHYYVTNLPAGKYSVRVALLGYVPQ